MSTVLMIRNVASNPFSSLFTVNKKRRVKPELFAQVFLIIKSFGTILFYAIALYIAVTSKK